MMEKTSCLVIEKKEKKLTKKIENKFLIILKRGQTLKAVVSLKLPNVSEYKIWTFVILHKKACQFLS